MCQILFSVNWTLCRSRSEGFFIGTSGVVCNYCALFWVIAIFSRPPEIAFYLLGVMQNKVNTQDFPRKEVPVFQAVKEMGARFMNTTERCITP